MLNLLLSAAPRSLHSALRRYYRHPPLSWLQSATGIICNITSRQVGLGEVHHIGEIISPMAGPGCSIKYGAVNDPTFAEDELQVTLM
jgi:cell division GTPase FtsZ